MGTSEGPKPVTTQPSADFFEALGQKADKVDKPQDDDGGEGEQAVEEIESMCMVCGENVS
jgi:hypothetical protein